MNGRRPVIEVEIDGYGSLVRGYGTREIVMDLKRGRPPTWSSTRRGWAVQEKTARDVIAVAELRNYDVVIIGPRSTIVRTTEMRCDDPARTPADPEAGLW